VYFAEFNVLMGNVAYLPLVSGLLSAYAQRVPGITAEYDLMPFLFHRDIPDRLLEKYEEPSVAAFSVYMWNEQLSLYIAEKLKERFPECLVVFGGAQPPSNAVEYFHDHPFLDVTVRGEGEETFRDILSRAIGSNDFGGIPGIAWRHRETGACIINPEERVGPKDLDQFPSPYQEGVFEYLFTENSGLKFQAIIETNRGCPFNCSYCYWGKGGLSTKYRFFSLDRVKADVDWCAKHRIEYVFNADSNFGMHKRDYEIASYLVEAKRKYGYPEKFRTCFGKNTDDRIFETGLLLHRHGLEKSITLSRQTNCDEALRNVRRQNIRMSTFNNLQRRLNQAEVPVYSELILGLPGETYESWVRGIEEHLQSGLKNQLFIYLCEVYPNTELAEPEYRKRFRIKTKTISLTEIHGSPRGEGEIGEFQEIIIETGSMPHAAWRKSVKFGWMTMLLHSMKLGFFVLKYLVDRYGIAYTDIIKYICDSTMPAKAGEMLRRELSYFDAQLDRLLQGGGRGHIMQDYGPIYWDEEEAGFLRISEDLGEFYAQFLTLVRHFLTEAGISYDSEELAEAMAYQQMRIPRVLRVMFPS
jgi:putative methyltransferase